MQGLNSVKADVWLLSPDFHRVRVIDQPIISIDPTSGLFIYRYPQAIGVHQNILLDLHL